ncbi:clotting factor C [Lasioglossum baleicum]|uniref:clotting factor C n=1 Tax=Lasioglossum baleicum TaxID=434251 RepID=UPI003FCDF32F
MRNTVIALFLIIITVLKTVHGQRSQCGVEKFQCKNGECIQSILLCDGRADCRDKSDETTTECTKPNILCPHTAFRCAYGACVDGDTTCNGVKDCIDNSDETLSKCNNSNTITECRRNEFKCTSGQCISASNICDGVADCPDGSDETFIQCGGISCEQLFFQCRYGACIDGDLKCNGVVNCADGSDENPTICLKITTSTTSTSTYRPPLTTSSTTAAYGPTCSAPPQPQNGVWKLDCPSGEHCHDGQEFPFRPGAHLVYSCNSGFKVKGSPDVFCNMGGQWWKDIPVCEEVRCKDLNSASIAASCDYPGSHYVTCESPRPRTVATLTCRDSYRVDRTLPSPTSVECTDTGQWFPEPLRCVPVCGIVPTPTTPLVWNGVPANITEFPWHATLYKAVKPNAKKEFLCGGSIIQERLLITAAHCVYDDNARHIDDPSKYFVVAGNIYRDYDSSLHHPTMVVKTAVKNIYVSCGYNGIHGLYNADIAILEVTVPFVFSALLQPICMDYSNHILLESDMFGRVAGFGRTALGGSSYLLQTITVPYIHNSKCKEASNTYETEIYITYDKFCAGYTNGSAVCDGDSGGGLIFRWGSLWYLKGIVSVSLGTKVVGGARQCDSSTYSLYTEVSRHMTWIENFILQLEINKQPPMC